MTDGERYDAWRYLRDGKYKIVIGPRSAILAPLDDLGLIIVDEEHEWSYKQSDQNPRYNARDLAVYRAKIANCPIILGSATPSLESYYNAKNGKYTLHQLLKRPNSYQLPDVHIIDLKKEIEKRPTIENRLISEELELAIEQRLLKKEQIILFMNKRGYSSYVQCNDCGEMIECPHCTITLVYHQKSQKNDLPLLFLRRNK
jgi:primosomal protein N' (replication factor Y) (superfamily II helicase)